MKRLGILIVVLSLFGCKDEEFSPGTYVNSTTTDLPGGEPTACEHEWTIRTIDYCPNAIFPRRMYFSACNTDTNAPDMFTSLTLGQNAEHPDPDPSSGGVIRARLNAGGEMEVVDQRHFPECHSMHGIATSEDCSVIGVLCRIPNGTKEVADADPLSEHPLADWMTNQGCLGGNHHEMWLYEWTDGDLQSDPKRYIVHKNIGSWEYGNNYLVYGENDNSYGIGLKTTVGEDGCHEADAFLIMDRSNHSLSTDRGWTWSCGGGHTIFNRPTYNPQLKKYVVHCTTDGAFGKVSLTQEHEEGEPYHLFNHAALAIKGGGSVLLPNGNKGYMGLLVGDDNPDRVEREYPELPPTSIGLVHFDPSGNLVNSAGAVLGGEVAWVAQNNQAYLSYPQLAKLGKNRYLLGWGVMHRTDGSDGNNRKKAYRIPWEYWLVEIDQNGAYLSAPQQLDGVGWGGQDQMVSLGRGRVGWAYISDPALPEPPCNSDTLQFTVYRISD